MMRAHASTALAPAPAARRRGGLLALGALALLLLAGVAYWRGGLLDLPAVPRDLTAERAGLADLRGLAGRERALEAAAAAAVDSHAPEKSGDAALAGAAAGLALIRHGEWERGLQSMREALELAPRDLVLANAYRMAVFRLKRTALRDAALRRTLAEELPPALAREPIATLGRLRREQPCRETTLALALAQVDEMLLFPALEIKAPASVESVNLLTEILKQNPFYVPALYGRGLNYLHRPARLVWPEAHKAAPDAAPRDLGLCVAIGRRIGGGSPELVATLALTLGDAYAKTGQAQRARSWWQIAENAGGGKDLRAAVRRRFTWQDDEVLDRLEAELDQRMLDLDHPLTDLSIMWR